MLEQVADSSNLYVTLKNDGSLLQKQLTDGLQGYKPGLDVIIDYSTESNYYFDSRNNFLYTLHELIKDAGIPAENVTLYTGNLIINRAYDGFKRQFQGIKPFKKVEFKDFWLKQTLKMHKDYSENYGKGPKPKYFCSLNGAGREHREMTYDYLHRHNMLDKGICSFVWKGISVDGLEDSAGYRHTVQPDDFYKIFDNTYYDLITETNTGLHCPHEWFEDIFLTEKIWRSIYYKRPFLLIGNYQALNYLKDLGFETFNDILFDESYDSESNHEIRINRVLQENKRIVDTYSLDQIDKIINFSEMAQILDNNYKKINRITKQQSVHFSQ